MTIQVVRLIYYAFLGIMRTCKQRREHHLRCPRLHIILVWPRQRPAVLSARQTPAVLPRSRKRLVSPGVGPGPELYLNSIVLPATPSLRGLLFVRPMLCVVSNQEMGVNMVLAWVLGQRIRNAKLCRLTLPY